ncbi:MAG: Bax inhibitor-1/YccA family protein [Pseudomonadota bacterium]|nr:Bax inhibitor-1/YccA family protein [Pseudomonadota bacterium]
MNMSHAASTVRTNDAAVAAYMRMIFNYMTGGVALSGLVAFLTINSPGLLQVAVNPATQLIFMVLWIGSGFVMAGLINRLQPAVALGLFAFFSALTGFALAPIALVYTGASVFLAFFTAAGMFAGASAYGYVTGKSLSGWGNFLMMGVWGLFFAVIINIVGSLMGFQMSGLDFMISLLAVPLFAGLTAYETNMLRDMYHQHAGDDVSTARRAIYGAYTLYVNFVIMFIHLLQLIGERR